VWKEPGAPQQNVDILIPKEMLQDAKQLLQQQKMLFTIMVNDVEDLLNEEEQSNQRPFAFASNLNMFFDYTKYNQWAEVFVFSVGKKSPKNSLKECVFVNSALKLQYHIVKNTSYRLLFGDFAHWFLAIYFLYLHVLYRLKLLQSFIKISLRLKPSLKPSIFQ